MKYDESTFPKLPKGFRWEIRYSSFYSPHVTARVKGRFGRLHAEDKSFVEYAPTVMDAAEKAAKRAYDKFTRNTYRDKIIRALQGYENELNQGAK